MRPEFASLEWIGKRLPEKKRPKDQDYRRQHGRMMCTAQDDSTSALLPWHRRLATWCQLHSSA